MLGGRLPETENKRICQTSGLNTGRSRLRNLSSGLTRELLEQYLTEKREVVAMRELTVRTQKHPITVNPSG